MMLRNPHGPAYLVLVLAAALACCDEDGGGPDGGVAAAGGGSGGASSTPSGGGAGGVGGGGTAGDEGTSCDDAVVLAELTDPAGVAYSHHVGVLDRPGDRDYFRFDVEAGEWLGMVTQANPDGDPLDNLFERTFGTNPLVPDDSPLSVELSPTMARYRFPWVKAVTDIDWHIETSIDAATWSLAPVSESSEAGADIDQILAEINAPPDADAQWFARLVLSLKGN